MPHALGPVLWLRMLRRHQHTARSRCFALPPLSQRGEVGGCLPPHTVLNTHANCLRTRSSVSITCAMTSGAGPGGVCKGAGEHRGPAAGAWQLLLLKTTSVVHALAFGVKAAAASTSTCPGPCTTARPPLPPFLGTMPPGPQERVAARPRVPARGPQAGGGRGGLPGD